MKISPFINSSVSYEDAGVISKSTDWTFVAMLLIKLLMSSWVGHDFWHGASAHFKHRAASFKAPRSLKVVCFTSSKLLSNGPHVYKRIKTRLHLYFHFQLDGQQRVCRNYKWWILHCISYPHFFSSDACWLLCPRRVQQRQKV